MPILQPLQSITLYHQTARCCSRTAKYHHFAPSGSSGQASRSEGRNLPLAEKGWKFRLFRFCAISPYGRNDALFHYFHTQFILCSSSARCWQALFVFV